MEFFGINPSSLNSFPFSTKNPTENHKNQLKKKTKKIKRKIKN